MSEAGFIGSSSLTDVKRNAQEDANTSFIVLCVCIRPFELIMSPNLHYFLHHCIVQDI